MDVKLIKNPSQSTLDIISSRSRLKFEDYIPGAIGLIQGKVIEMLVASDIAEKNAEVNVSDVRGLCPQHFTILAIAGDVSSVEIALKNIENELGTGK